MRGVRSSLESGQSNRTLSAVTARPIADTPPAGDPIQYASRTHHVWADRRRGRGIDQIRRAFWRSFPYRTTPAALSHKIIEHQFALVAATSDVGPRGQRARTIARTITRTMRRDEAMRIATVWACIALSSVPAF